MSLVTVETVTLATAYKLNYHGNDNVVGGLYGNCLLEGRGRESPKYIDPRE